MGLTRVQKYLRLSKQLPNLHCDASEEIEELMDEIDILWKRMDVEERIEASRILLKSGDGGIRPNKKPKRGVGDAGSTPAISTTTNAG